MNRKNRWAIQRITSTNPARMAWSYVAVLATVLGGSMSFGKVAAASAARREDRLRLESCATKLQKEVPSLKVLRIAVTELGMLTHQKHLKHVVVASAPALFLFACGDAQCEHGGHDVTSSVLYSLRALRTEFTGQHACDGTVGLSPCRRSIEFQAFAGYA